MLYDIDCDIDTFHHKINYVLLNYKKAKIQDKIYEFLRDSQALGYAKKFERELLGVF